jgi:hypothetical protein
LDRRNTCRHSRRVAGGRGRQQAFEVVLVHLTGLLLASIDLHASQSQT